ncbi:aminotransferase class V-fold PLP-dependent enzyme [Myxacorys almedinensis]|uniref:Aminotransferase class V-fold PLP-dependent enzyme n=1 Tax=Myxacorys almedinensis A TaxID=2690445 RepID=A0A8J8CIM7_9CYAN|nr:aminotransferase class V-fold PLP-dependent enzyme [Myxacorys almedinensis]NDJ18018.1 aminotransferase class V-fold PLP-dependent enzyme [Myxacorys almedinensis A]
MPHGKAGAQADDSSKLQPSDFRQLWLLDSEVTFLNHGSFGACPIPVLEFQQTLRQRLEQQPLLFFSRDFETLLDETRQTLAKFVGSASEDLVFVPNATTGVNAVLRSLPFTPNDELLTTNQEYNACRNALDFVAERTGATVVIADVPYPIASADQVIEPILQAVSSKTRLALLDHITSQTGLVLPIARLVQALTQRGVETLVDGAHAPGMVPLSLHDIGATYYTGNCHKWLCSPKGAAFLYVQRDRQDAIRPLTISHGANSPRRVGVAPLGEGRSRFQLEFDWMGTDDPTAYLSVAKAIEWMGLLLPGGWAELRANNRDKAIAARTLLCDLLQVEPPCPEEMLGSLATIPLPDGSYTQLQNALWDEFQIEVPIVPYPNPPKRLVRISAQLYNTLDQYAYLGRSLLTLFAN